MSEPDILDDNPIDRLTSAVMFLHQEHPAMEILSMNLPNVGLVTIYFSPTPETQPLAGSPR